MIQAAATREQTNGPMSQEQNPEYLDCLQALARELECAMQSLAENRLPSFDESVSRQVVLCSQLTSLAARHPSGRTGSSSTSASSAGDHLSARIDDAKANLLKLNRNYSALLNHTRRTVQMFAGLAQCYSGYPRAGSAIAVHRTWSSEM